MKELKPEVYQKGKCTDVLVNKLGEVAVCHLLDPAPDVVELEHQQLRTSLQLLIPHTVSRL